MDRLYESRATDRVAHLRYRCTFVLVAVHAGNEVPHYANFVIIAAMRMMGMCACYVTRNVFECRWGRFPLTILTLCVARIALYGNVFI